MILWEQTIISITQLLVYFAKENENTNIKNIYIITYYCNNISGGASQ